MARLNCVHLLGIVENKKIESKKILQEDGSFIPVMNLSIECFVKEDKRSYRLPIAIWGRESVDSCKKHLQCGDFIYANGELRYHFYHNKETGKIDRVYTAVKTESIEFVSEEMGKKPHEISYYKELYTNEVKLMGTIVEKNNSGIVLAVDRLAPPLSTLDVSRNKCIDFITVVPSKRFSQKGKIQSGDFVMVKGNLITRKKQENIAIPRIVVSAESIISGNF